MVLKARQALQYRGAYKRTNTMTAPTSATTTKMNLKPATLSARTIVSGEGGVAKGLKMLSDCFTEQSVTEKKGKAYTAIATAWRDEYQSKKECSEDASRAAWKKYSDAALKGATNLEGSQNRKAKTEYAKGAKVMPKLAGAMPPHIVAVNIEAGEQSAEQRLVQMDNGEVTAKVIPLSARQGLALNVNKAQAAALEIGNLIADVPADSFTGYPALLAAFQILNQSIKDVARSAKALA